MKGVLRGARSIRRLRGDSVKSGGAGRPSSPRPEVPLTGVGLVVDVVDGPARAQVVEKWRGRPGCGARSSGRAAAHRGRLRVFEADREAATGELFRSLAGRSARVGLPLELWVGSQSCDGRRRSDLRTGALPRWQEQRRALLSELEGVRTACLRRDGVLVEPLLRLRPSVATQSAANQGVANPGVGDS